MIQFRQPLALLLLLLLPLVIALGWPARGAARRREISSLVLRCLIMACLVLALAGLEFAQPAGLAPRAVVFVVDLSASISSQARAAEEAYIRQALQSMGPDDQAAIVVFAEQALVERPMSKSSDFQKLTSAPGRNGSDLAGGIQLAISLFPPNLARRMVILSDGQQTSGDARQAVRLANEVGIEVVAAQINSLLQNPGQEVILKSLTVPENLRQGEQFDLNIELETSQPLTASLPVSVFSNGALVYTGTLSAPSPQPEPGAEGYPYAFNLPLSAKQFGFSQYQVVISPPAGSDLLFQNNELAAFTQVAGPPQVLVVAPPAGEELPGGELRPDETTVLELALKGGGAGALDQPVYALQHLPPLQLPAEVQRLAQYAAILLVDVPASSLTQGQMEGLQNYVRLGGGLVAVGGPTSFGVGGYFQTPLEATLPVDMQIKDEKRRPSLGIVFIIDHSGSMSDLSGGQTKLEIAKEAVIRSLDMLNPQDRVGVLAFDDQATWVVPLGPLTNKAAVKNLVGTLQPGGGTDILAGIQAMARVLPGDSAVNKHVILLTDGGADPTGIPELVKSLHDQNGITLSTVGVGRDAAAFLPDLAKAGAGRYHFAATPAQIPRIFSEETALATRSYIIEGAFLPVLASRLLADTLGIRSTPPLSGYVATSAKDGSQVILQSPAPNQDPILSVWNYGLGKAAAFTSDATTRWAAAWVFQDENHPVLRPQFVQFWQGLMRYVMGSLSSQPLDVQVKTSTDQSRLEAQVVVDTAISGQFLNGYDMQAEIVDPQGSDQVITLEQFAPGKYAGSFAPSAQGVYILHVAGKRGQPANGAADVSTPEEVGETTGWVLAYSPEYAHVKSKSDRQKLLLLLAAGSGTSEPFITSDQAFAFFGLSSQAAAALPAWPWLLALAALLLPLDIAVRRLMLTVADLRRAGQAVRRLVSIGGSSAKTGPASPARSERLQLLLRAKGGPENSARPTPAVPPKPAASPGNPPPAPSPAETPRQDQPAASPPPAAPPANPPKDPGASSVQLLLKEKRKRSDSSSEKN